MKIVFSDGRDSVFHTEELPDTRTVNSVAVTQEMIRRAGDTLKIRFEQPVRNIQGYWTSDQYRPQMQLPWGLKLDSAAQRQMPFLVWFDQAGVTQAAFYLTDTADDASLQSRLSQSDSAFRLEWTIRLSPETQPFEFAADRRALPFPETAASFRQRLLPENPVFPAGAWDPVYCTWYAFHAAYTIPELEKNAGLAAGLGFRTFILDDGWSYDTSKRLNSSTVSEWFSENGDWILSERKLPGFADHVKRIRDMGFNYLLWFAPFLTGRSSWLYAELKKANAILLESDDGSAAADPACPLIREVVIPRILEVFRKYHLDGLKVDFVDFVHPSLSVPRGRECLKQIRSLAEQLRAVKPDALIEFRQRYTTPAMLPYATNFRANDVPFDYLENLHRCCQIRMILGDGVPVHADPVCFHPEESRVNVARHMIASLAGVPMLSADLTKISPEHLAVIRRFLRFYHDHLATFRTGHWTIRYDFGHVASVAVENETEMIATAVTEIPPAPAGKNFILMNLSAGSLPFEADRIEDCDGNAAAVLQPGGIAFRRSN